MEKENGKQDGIKIIFSLISLFLMIPLLISNESGNYYRTLFIFLINRIIDMFFGENNSEKIFFIIWHLINQWLGVIACAIAFCSIDLEFQNVFRIYENIIKIGLFTLGISCIMQEMIKLIFTSVKESIIKDKIKNDMAEI